MNDPIIPVEPSVPAEVCSISILQRGDDREFYARVRAGKRTMVTGPWATKDALLDCVSRWLSDSQGRQ